MNISISPQVKSVIYLDVFGQETTLSFKRFKNVMVEGANKTKCFGIYSSSDRKNEPFEWFTENIEKSLNSDYIKIRNVILNK